MKLASVLVGVLLSVIISPVPVDLEKVARTTVKFELQPQVVDGPECSGTAIGKHALLTATHCESPTEKIRVNGRDATIVFLLRDGADHTIYLLSGVEFEYYARVFQNEMAVGDEVFMFGNPAGFSRLYRKGVVSGQYFLDDEKKLAIVLDINNFYGDSGAGVFNKNGDLLGVMSLLLGNNQKQAQFKVAGLYAMKFHPEDLENARTW